MNVQGPLVDKWNQLYPGKPFPDPSTYPGMYPPNFKIQLNTVSDSVLLSSDCTGLNACPKGLLDYECQLQRSCYANLISLAVHFIVFAFGLLAFCILSGYATKIIYKIVTALVFMKSVVGCLGSCIKCFSFGVFQEKVYNKKDVSEIKRQKKEKRRTIDKRIEGILQQMQIKVDLNKLNEQQKQNIMALIEDHEIISES